MKKYLFGAFVAVLCLCVSSNVFAAADGWASQNGGTSGGAGGPTVTVTDEPNLLKYATDATPGPYIIQILGTINIPPESNDYSLQISAKKTLRGIGINPTLIGNIDFKNRDGNIIVENLNITNPCTSSTCDGISLKQEIYNVLVTKCTIYNTGDGAFDISNNSDFITVSWCKFYYSNPAPVEDHRFACLVGSSDKQSDDDANLRVTYHHNWWANRVKERMPRVRYGQVHVYNNYYSNLESGGYCIGVGCGSRIRVESNYFNTVPSPWANYYTGETDCSSDGHIGWDTNNIFYDCNEPNWATNEYATIFTPPYSYTLDDANVLPIIVPAYAGAGTPYPPHWLFTVYGDFDRDGKVEIDDLKTFASYWLTDDSDADYDGDGIVDFYEFSLMAGNWMQ